LSVFCFRAPSSNSTNIIGAVPVIYSTHKVHLINNQFKS
jgi:hypothetical protein